MSTECRVEGCTEPGVEPAGLRPDDGLLCEDHVSLFLVDPRQWEVAAKAQGDESCTNER